MKRILTMLTVLVFTSFTLTAIAQHGNGRVDGSVKDESQKAIDGATISLLRAKDSSIAKIAAANKSGNFNFDGLSDGKYLVAISGVGFRKEFSQIFDIN